MQVMANMTVTTLGNNNSTAVPGFKHS